MAKPKLNQVQKRYVSTGYSKGMPKVEVTKLRTVRREYIKSNKKK